ncbi:DEAD/DEAH box helicase [Salsipaludibacter albus]|uniref:DEAD/DEAH box helicase n=1 Tax=Salsipaludibacter albus TaxID=2849650 RepID=UPI002368E07E|nr:DEAD/DEAH box helicase [Salsipaludibacter albus]MBY5161783.1 DEAD/DEAH box helicase [Salsipaludibacter albus]
MEDDEGLVHVSRLPARTPDWRDLPPMDDLLASRLSMLGIDRAFSHQVDAIEAVRAGRHTIVATGTASGKSLAYQVPVIDTLLGDDTATALYLSPTKALARDQLRQVRAFRLPGVRAAVVDGDTPTSERDAIRRRANLVLTNPDLLHHSVLPGHRYWGDFLHRLRHVVVDEAHTARGVFGSHVSLVLRRLRRLLERYDADPTFVLASATIGNPADHAAALTGLEVEAVVRDGSGRGPLEIGLWQPPFDDRADGRRRSLLGEVGDLLASFVAAGTQTLVFTGSRKAAEVIAGNARDRLDAELRAGVRSYRAGYLPQERRDLEERLRDGRIRGLAATSALELGIDVAGLDAVVLAGYPGTIASMWQRFGRAGRGGEAAIGVLVAGEDPLDQYLVHHPDQLLGRSAEDAIIDPQNRYLLGPHLRCAAHEAPLDVEDAPRWFGPAATDVLDDEVAAGRLRARAGKVHWTGRRGPAGDVDLRSIGGGEVRIIDAETGALVGTVDSARARDTVHEGAIYLHQGTTWEVAALDLERGLAAAERVRTNHTTRPRRDTDVQIVDELEHRDLGAVQLALDRVAVTNTVTGYDLLRLGSRDVLASVPLDLPPLHLDTVAVRWTITEDALGAVGGGLLPRRWPGSLHAAEHAAIGMLPLLALCDRWDIGGLSTVRHADTGLPTVFVYDGHQGGAGLAETSFRRFAEHVEATRDVVAGCRCDSGCPSCVQSPKCGNGNDPLDKAGAVDVLVRLLAAT